MRLLREELFAQEGFKDIIGRMSRGEVPDSLLSEIESLWGLGTDRLARQLVVAAQVKGMVNGPPPSADHADTIQALWTAILSEPEIGPGAVHLLSLVGPNDAVIVLDRAITRDIWSGR